MSVVVFTGPTLAAAEASRVLDATYLGPVAQGDVYRATLAHPIAIGIIDGFFERMPAVWHKEILFALHEGIHVFGSASMGALRAAELEAFGMVGVGAIFEAFRDGVLEDDDEVAVAHGVAETAYRASSEAMVNIRRVLADARGAGILTAATHDALVAIAKADFYPRRTYPQLLEAAAEQGVPAMELAALVRWLPDNRVDQKREDALAMLRAMQALLADRPGPKTVRFPFEYTDMWEALVCDAGEAAVAPDASDDERVLLHLLLDEVRLEGRPFAEVLDLALARLLASDEARREGLVPRDADVQQTADRFRREQGLLETCQIKAWLAANDLDATQFGRLMEEETRVRWVTDLAGARARRLVPDTLRASGRYGAIMARARHKQRTLHARGLTRPSFAALGVDRQEVLRWYFEERLGRPVPDDLGRHAEVAGFVDEVAFVRAILREYCYASD